VLLQESDFRLAQLAEDVCLAPSQIKEEALLDENARIQQV
jgi:predicted transcriptional regulator